MALLMPQERENCKTGVISSQFTLEKERKPMKVKMEHDKMNGSFWNLRQTSPLRNEFPGFGNWFGAWALSVGTRDHDHCGHIHPTGCSRMFGWDFSWNTEKPPVTVQKHLKMGEGGRKERRKEGRTGKQRDKIKHQVWEIIIYH